MHANCKIAHVYASPTAEACQARAEHAAGIVLDAQICRSSCLPSRALPCAPGGSRSGKSSQPEAHSFCPPGLGALRATSVGAAAAAPGSAAAGPPSPRAAQPAGSGPCTRAHQSFETCQLGMPLKARGTSRSVNLLGNMAAQDIPGRQGSPQRRHKGPALQRPAAAGQLHQLRAEGQRLGMHSDISAVGQHLDQGQDSMGAWRDELQRLA